MKIVHLVDYGTGNIGSIVSTIEKLGLFANVSHSPAEIREAQLVLLPGVGAAGIALKNLKLNGVYDALNERYEKQRPIAGICLGAQLFGNFLHEADENGFGWLRGDVAPIASYPFYNNGWCRLDYDALKIAGLARALTPSSTFYFNHKYTMGLDARKKVAVDKHPEIPAIYLDDVICAIQFHPEKSQDSGLILLRNLIQDHYGL